MHCTKRLMVGKNDDQPFNLSPVAEMDVVADIPALVRAYRRFIPCIVTKARDEVRSIFIALAVRQIRQLHGGSFFCFYFDPLCTDRDPLINSIAVPVRRTSVHPRDTRVKRALVMSRSGIFVPFQHSHVPICDGAQDTGIRARGVARIAHDDT